MARIQARPLSAQDYRPYGDVIAARPDIVPKPANSGTALRFDFVAALDNLRPGRAIPNLCVFRSEPQIIRPQASFEIRLLENHPHSTQAFTPMRGSDRYLVVVCLGRGKPDLSTLRAFMASGSQGVSYKPGIWHHPLIVMERTSDFACLVWEDGTSQDCETVNLAAGIIIEVGEMRE